MDKNPGEEFERPSPAPTAPTTTPNNTTPVDSLAPAGRTMEQAIPVAASEKKHNTGLIIGIIVAIVVLIVGAVLATLALNKGESNPVLAAMDKIMGGNAPKNVVIDGDIDINIKDNGSPISKVRISLDSKLSTVSAINETVAQVTATVRNVGDFNVEFDEVYAGNGNLYFKLDGVIDSLEESGILYLLNLTNQMPGIVDCGEDEYCQNQEIQSLICEDEEDCDLMEIDDTEFNVLDNGQNILNENTINYFVSLMDAVELIDGEWLKISVDELGMLSNGITYDSSISCITNLVSDLNTNSNSAAELYNEYPFVTATNKDVQLASKLYPVYRVSLNSENFANYVNSIQNSKISSDLYSCLGWDNNVKISSDDAAAIVAEMPETYTEVDKENNFTRLYLESSSINDSVSMKIDLNFSYPNNISVTEPDEYSDFSDMIKEIMSSMYTLY